MSEITTCTTCKTPISEIKGKVWNSTNGYQCDECHDKEHEKAKQEALDAMKQKEYCEMDYRYNDKIICPYCDNVVSSEDIYDSTDIDCEVCDNTFELEIDWNPSYTTVKKD